MRKRARKPLTAQAVEKSMEQHDGLVHAFVRRQEGGAVPYDEALQAGRIALWCALKGCNPTRGNTFFVTAYWLAEQGHKVLVFSVDPQASLTDIFEQDILGNGAAEIIPNLYAPEIDADRHIQGY